MVIVADGRGRTDSVYHTLVTKIKSELPLVIVSWVEGFVFNEALLGVKDYILICFCEYGYDFEIKNSHIWGQGNATERYSGGDWDKLENWVKENPFKILFKRELLKKDVSDNVVPIEYPCLLNEYPVQTVSEFNSRPINVFQYWGRSNEERLRIHGEIWLHAYDKGFQPCDNIFYINHYLQLEHGEKWITLWIPHYARIDIKELMNVNNLSKLSLSWMGSGFKCFRTAEAPTNSVMVMHRNEYAWSHDWNESNCILVKKFDETDSIEKALARTDLYQIYNAGVENSKKYMLDQYIPFIENIINKA